jgi:hypothetical protein
MGGVTELRVYAGNSLRGFWVGMCKPDSFISFYELFYDKNKAT